MKKIITIEKAESIAKDICEEILGESMIQRDSADYDWAAQQLGYANFFLLTVAIKKGEYNQ